MLKKTIQEKMNLYGGPKGSTTPVLPKGGRDITVANLTIQPKWLSSVE